VADGRVLDIADVERDGSVNENVRRADEFEVADEETLQPLDVERRLRVRPGVELGDEAEFGGQILRRGIDINCGRGLDSPDRHGRGEAREVFGDRRGDDVFAFGDDERAAARFGQRVERVLQRGPSSVEPSPTAPKSRRSKTASSTAARALAARATLRALVVARAPCDSAKEKARSADAANVFHKQETSRAAPRLRRRKRAPPARSRRPAACARRGTRFD
jgi:hypothetical protein